MQKKIQTVATALKQKKYIEDISGCFRSLNPEDFEYLNSKKTHLKYLSGETIFKQGAFASHVLFVNEGLVRIYNQIDDSKQINIRIAREGDYMAFSTIFNKNMYEYSAVALSDATICMIEKEALRKVLLRNPEFAIQIVSKNSSNESRYLEIINNVSHKQMRGKLASSLIYLSAEDFLEDNIFSYLTRKDIADFAAITVESAVKFLKEFEREGIIELNNKDIVIKDAHRLRFIAQKG